MKQPNDNYVHHGRMAIQACTGIATDHHGDLFISIPGSHVPMYLLWPVTLPADKARMLPLEIFDVAHKEHAMLLLVCS